MSAAHAGRAHDDARDHADAHDEGDEGEGAGQGPAGGEGAGGGVCGGGGGGPSLLSLFNPQPKNTAISSPRRARFGLGALRLRFPVCAPCTRQALFWTLNQAIDLTKRIEKAVRQGVREYAGMMVGGEPPHRYQTGDWFSLLVTKAGPNQAALSLGNGTMPPSAALSFQTDSRRVLESSEGYTPPLSLSLYIFFLALPPNT